MKAIKSLIFICLVWNFGFSQSWLPIHPNDSSNYTLSSNGKITSLWVDSVKIVNSDTIFYSNKVCRQLSSYGIPDYYLLLNQSSFLLSNFMKKGDTIQFSDSNTDLKYRLILNDTSEFVFDSIHNITAHRIIKTDTLLWNSLIDSICVYRLSSEDTLIISKKLGILKFPAAPEDGYYELSGIQNNYGTQIPMFMDFFNYNPGDVLEYTIEEETSGYPYLTINRTKRISFIAKFIFDDTLEYTCEIKEIKISESELEDPDTTYIIQNENIQFINIAYSFINELPGDSIQIPPSYINPVTLKFDTSFNCMSKFFGGKDSYAYFTNNMSGDTMSYYPYDYSSQTFPIYLEDIDPFALNVNNWYYGLSFLYGEGLGLLEKKYHHTNYGPGGYSYFLKLTAAKTSTIEFGVFSTDPFLVKTELQPVNNRVNIFPNPAKDIITVKLPLTFDLNNAFVVIFNMQGQKMFQIQLESLKREIDIAMLVNGMYFISVYNDHSSVIAKLVKE